MTFNVKFVQGYNKFPIPVKLANLFPQEFLCLLIMIEEL